TGAVCIVGKASILHVAESLRVSHEEALDMVRESVAYLKARAGEVLFDAEHFFDGYRLDPAFALSALRAAGEAGADYLVLCDTNGGSLPFEVAEIVRAVCAEVPYRFGIHAHNDTENAVANSLAAVEAGRAPDGGLRVAQVQGTINGLGERCGNANLCSIIPNLQLKMGIPAVPEDRLARLTAVSRTVYELLNQQPPKHQPYVGESAFAHKGGLHASAVRRLSETYEHIAPEKVGNRRKILVSDQSGRSNLLAKAEEFGLRVDGGDPRLSNLLDLLKQMEHDGYQFEAAEASFELLMRRMLAEEEHRFFRLVGFHVMDEKREEGDQPFSTAIIRVEVGGKRAFTAAEGNGPVSALDGALRQVLTPFYPELAEMRLVDYKVRVLDGRDGAEAKVRVLIESADAAGRWGTVGVSTNIIEASRQALVDAIVYKLMK
ncbi:MAG: citramalate synthase, partial [Candidatus Methylomirabilis sp.]|nr:citramalate synthase [Deltaproteobacteria bacterium]